VDARGLGLLLVGVGVLAVVVGALIYFEALSWFGHLPGDVHFESDRVRVYIPFASMLLISLVLTLLLNLLRRWL
jgi:hypothetical protein